MKPKLLFSVIVATHNRAQLLSSCLKSLLAQTLPASKHQIIIVNNASSDNTNSIVKAFTKKHSHLHLTSHSHLGFSTARNHGAKFAQGQYLAFIDDDATADPHWLEAAAKVVTTHHPLIFGGPIYPFFKVQPPAWYKKTYKLRSYGARPHYLHSEEYLFGSNLFIAHQLFSQLKGFDTTIGRKGNNIAFGAETQLQIRATQLHHVTPYYHPSLKVHHLTAARKLSLIYACKAAWAQGLSARKIYPSPKPPLLKLILKTVSISLQLILLLLSLPFRDRSRYPYWQNFAKEVIIPKLYWHARLYARLKP